MFASAKFTSSPELALIAGSLGLAPFARPALAGAVSSEEDAVPDEIKARHLVRTPEGRPSPNAHYGCAPSMNPAPEPRGPPARKILDNTKLTTIRPPVRGRSW